MSDWFDCFPPISVCKDTSFFATVHLRRWLPYCRNDADYIEPFCSGEAMEVVCTGDCIAQVSILHRWGNGSDLYRWMYCTGEEGCELENTFYGYYGYYGKKSIVTIIWSISKSRSFTRLRLCYLSIIFECWKHLFQYFLPKKLFVTGNLEISP